MPEGTEGSGLVIRRWRPADAPALHEAVAASVEHLRPYMAWIGFEPLDVADRVELIERWDDEWFHGGDAVYGIFRDGVVVGGSGLHRRIGPDALEIGYWVHVDHVGQGVATDASRALTDLAFTLEGIERVEIHHDVTNAASRRVPEKLGFARIGEAASGRDEQAPAETGTDAIWRMTREAWLSG